MCRENDVDQNTHQDVLKVIAKDEEHIVNAKKTDENLSLKDSSCLAKRKCNYCGKVFKYRDSTSIHVRKMHAQSFPVQSLIAMKDCIDKAEDALHKACRLWERFEKQGLYYNSHENTYSKITQKLK